MKAWVCWSGGKDSAYALALARERGDLEVTGLLTTLSAEFDRVSMHGVRRSLLEAQAEALGLPVTRIFLSTPPADALCRLATAPDFTVFPSDDDYERRMLAALAQARAGGVEAIVFGDIYLADLRRYRERMLEHVGLRGIFPLWGRDSRELAAEVLARGVRATVVCVDGKRLDRSFCGRALDPAFLGALPPGVDPSGELGEYHCFVHDGPGFRRPLPLLKGECLWREPFWFCDLLLDELPMQARAA